MSSLKELRTRIKSVHSTKKITAAMKLVASSKLRKAQEQLENIRNYANHFISAVSDIASKQEDCDVLPTLFKGTPGAPALVIAIGPRKGLCGGYNTHVLKEAILTIEWLKKEDENVILLPFGGKLQDALFKQYREDAEVSFLEKIEHNPKTLASYLIQLIESKAIGSIYIVTGYLQNILKQPIQTTQLLPFQTTSKLDPSQNQPLKNSDIIFEPGIDTLFPLLLVHNFLTQLEKLFLENDGCEFAARMTAMDSATQNSNSMIHDLQLEYNQTRQAHITRELIEIISGANQSMN
jgi:F-type H+-transporting ATPase subunit gamma